MLIGALSVTAYRVMPLASHAMVPYVRITSRCETNLADCGNTRLTPQITQHIHRRTEPFSSRTLLCVCAISVLLWCHRGCFGTLLVPRLFRLESLVRSALVLRPIHRIDLVEALEAKLLAEVDLAGAWIGDQFMCGASDQHATFRHNIGSVGNLQCLAHIVIGQ